MTVSSPIKNRYFHGCFSQRIVSTFCGEREDVVGVPSLLSGVVQVCHERLVGEEEEEHEGTRTARREESKKRRSKRREHTHVDDHVDGMNVKSTSPTTENGYENCVFTTRTTT